MGGSSAINGQIAIRGMLEDFDIWAGQGCAGWSGQEVLPAFIRLENDLDFGDKAYHGRSGPIPIYRAPREKWGAVDKSLCDAALDLGYGWAEDHNAPGATGVSPYAINSLNGVRVSTNDGYLEPARDRPNLTIQGETVVGCVCFDGQRSTGVRAITPDGWREYQARETIVACGAVHSPGVLIRSGLGPAEQLQALGMQVPAAVYARSPRVYRGLDELTYPFHDQTIAVTRCGRICFKGRKINLSHVFAGQNVGVTQVGDRLWLVTFMQYDLGYFDDETCRLEPIDNPFGPKVLPMCSE